MDSLKVPDDVATGGPESDDRIGVHVGAEPLPAVVVWTWAARRNEDEPARGVDGHHGPDVRGAGPAPAVTGPRGPRGIRLAHRDGVPAPAKRATPRVVRADDTSLEISRAIVTDGRADDHEVAHHGGRRRHLIAAAISANLDAGSQVDFAASAELGAWCARGRVERDETGVNRGDEDAAAAPAIHTGVRIEPGRHAARRDDGEPAGAINLGVIAPSLLAGLRVERDDTVVRRAEEERVLHHERRGFECRVGIRSDAAGLAGSIGPGDAKVRDGAAIDLRERGVPSAARVVPVARPFAVLGGVTARGVETGGEEECRERERRDREIHALRLSSWATSSAGR